MTIELRPLDLAMFQAICEAFAMTDASQADRVAQLCSEAAAWVHNPALRAYESPGYETIGGQSWRETLHSMFEGFVRDGLQARLGTIEQWGGELASHLMTILAMPSFQTRYLLVEGESEHGNPHVQWAAPVTLVVLGEMDGGLLTLLEPNAAVGELLRLTRQIVVRLVSRGDGPGSFRAQTWRFCRRTCAKSRVMSQD